MAKVTMYKTSSQGFLKVNVLKLKCLNIATPKIAAMIIREKLKLVLFMILKTKKILNLVY